MIRTRRPFIDVRTFCICLSTFALPSCHSPRPSIVLLPKEGGLPVSKGWVSDKAVCRFSLSTDGTQFTPAGEPFQARKGKWIGAKVGIFAVREGKTYESGYADFDWFRIE